MDDFSSDANFRECPGQKKIHRNNKCTVVCLFAILRIFETPHIIINNSHTTPQVICVIYNSLHCVQMCVTGVHVCLC